MEHQTQQYFKNIDQLYKNNFDDIQEFRILKNYRTKLLTNSEYTDNLLLLLNYKHIYINNINEFIEHIDMMIYLILILKSNETIKNGLIFNYSINDKFKNKQHKKHYEPTNLKLLLKYDIIKLYSFYKLNDGFKNIIKFVISNKWNIIKNQNYKYEINLESYKNKVDDELKLKLKINKYFNDLMIL